MNGRDEADIYSTAVMAAILLSPWTVKKEISQQDMDVAVQLADALLSKARRLVECRNADKRFH